MPNPEVKTHPISIAMKRLPHGVDIDLPSYATTGAAGMDIRAAVETDFTLAPGERHAIPCGFAIAVPPGYEAQIGRAGLATNMASLLPMLPARLIVTIAARLRWVWSILAARILSSPVACALLRW